MTCSAWDRRQHEARESATVRRRGKRPPRRHTWCRPMIRRSATERQDARFAESRNDWRTVEGIAITE